MSMRIAVKIASWRRAGLLGPVVIRQQIAALEREVDGPWSPEVSTDLDELHAMLEDMERPG
jgi:hypothetical protein